MKHYLPGFLFLLFFGVNISLNAQETVAVNMGKPYEVIDAFSKQYFLVDDRIVTIKTDTRYWHTQVLDAEGLTETARAMTKRKDALPKKAKIQKYLKVDHKVYIFYSLWDRKRNLEELFAMEIDNKSAQIKEAKKITEVPYETSGFYFIRSIDRKKIGLRFSEVLTLKNRKNTSFGFMMLNENLELLWKTEIDIPHDPGLYENEHYTVTNNGDVYFLTKYYQSKIDKRKSEFDLELVSLTEEGGVYDAFQLKFNDFYIEDLLIRSLEDKDDIFCAGYYRKEKKGDQTDGIMTFYVTRTGEVEDLNKHEIPREVIDQFLTEADKKSNKKQDRKDEEVGFNNLRMDYAVFYDDGSFSLIGEQRKIVITEHVHSSPSGTYTSTNYKYFINNILATYITSEGEVGWMNVIPKQQYMSTATYYRGSYRDLSYTMVESETGYHLVYFDNVKNLNLQPGESPHKHVSSRGGYLTSAHVSFDGKVTKHSIFDVTDVKGMPVYQYEVNRIIETEEDTFVMEVYKKEKEDILIEVEF